MGRQSISRKFDRGRFAHYREGGKLRGIGMLADQAWMLRALIGAYAATLEEHYLTAARDVADFILGELIDEPLLQR